MYKIKEIEIVVYEIGERVKCIANGRVLTIYDFVITTDDRVYYTVEEDHFIYSEEELKPIEE